MAGPYTVAVLSDVHGNVAALEAVLADLATRPHDAVVFAGDLAQGGPRPAEALARIRALGVPAVYGNADRAVVDDDPVAGSRWTRERVGAEGVAYLDSLPFSHTVLPPGGADPDDALLIVHAAPTDVNGLLITHEEPGVPATLTPEDEAAALIGDARANLILHGHIHYFSEGVLAGRRVASIGAVGFPADGDHRAAYALVAWDGANWRLTPVRVPYDHLAVAADARASDSPNGERAAWQLEQARMRAH